METSANTDSTLFDKLDQTELLHDTLGELPIWDWPDAPHEPDSYVVWTRSHPDFTLFVWDSDIKMWAFSFRFYKDGRGRFAARAKSSDDNDKVIIEAFGFYDENGKRLFGLPTDGKTPWIRETTVAKAGDSMEPNTMFDKWFTYPAQHYGKKMRVRYYIHEE